MKKWLITVLFVFSAQHTLAVENLSCQKPKITHSGLEITQQCTFKGTNLDTAYQAFYRFKKDYWIDMGLPAQLPKNGYVHNHALPKVDCGRVLQKDGSSIPHIAEPRYETTVKRTAQLAIVHSEYVYGCADGDIHEIRFQRKGKVIQIIHKNQTT